MKKIINLGVIGSGFIVDTLLEAASEFEKLNLNTLYSRI